MNVREKLAQLGVKPVKGQNFLSNEAVVEALVEAGEVDSQKVLEIGPGTGIITEKLAGRASKVYAVENDTVLAGHLEDEFSDSNVEVFNKDFLDWEWKDVDRCVSNLPFQISSKAIERLGEKQVQSALIVQKELAEKIVADPGDKRYGFFTVKCNYYFIPVKLRDVSRKNFHPSPDVDTSIVKLYPNKERHDVEDEEELLNMAKALFTHKRKKARNAFVDARHMLDIDKEKAKELRDKIPHSEKRANNLNIREISEITEFYLQNT